MSVAAAGHPAEDMEEGAEKGRGGGGRERKGRRGQRKEGEEGAEKGRGGGGRERKGRRGRERKGEEGQRRKGRRGREREGEGRGGEVDEEDRVRWRKA